MNPYLSSQLYQAERPKTRAELIAADTRRGEIAASVSRLRRAVSGRARAAAGQARVAVAGARRPASA